MVLALGATLFWVAGFHQIGILMRVEQADSTADLIVTKAFWDGVDPYQDVYDLADVYSIGYFNALPRGELNLLIHPRTPGSLIVMGPIAPLTAEETVTAMLLVGLVSVSVGTLLLAHTFRLRYLLVLAAVAYGSISGPARWSHFFATQSTLLWGCIALVVIGLHRQRWVLAGTVLGIAGTLKIFPLVILFLLVRARRWKAVIATLCVVVLLSVVALLTPHVTLAGAVEAMSSGSDNWFRLRSNLSLAAVLNRTVGLTESGVLRVQGSAIAIGLVTFVIRKMSYAVGVPFLLAIGLLASPLTWPHYLLVLIPALLPVFNRIKGINYWSVALAVGVALTLPFHQIGLQMLGVAVIAVALAVASDRIEASGPAAWNTETINVPRFWARLA